MDEIGYPQKAATLVYDDNQGAISTAKCEQTRPALKHVRIRYHFIRQQVLTERTIELRHVSSKEQLADILTKALPKPAFIYLRDKLGILPVCSA